MSKRIQGLIIGILIGVIISGSVAYAATAQLKVSYNNIKIVVDGKEITPRDASGKIVEPFISSGTTYLPVRAVADALGKAVYWDGPNYTVYIGYMSETPKQPTLRLKDAQNIGQYRWYTDTNVEDNYGNTYTDVCESAWTNKGSKPIAEYLLNMKYSSFQGTFFVPSGETSGDTWSFEIIADSNIIYTSPPLNKASAPVKFNVSVKGYNHIIIKNTSYSYSSIYLGDAGFYQ